MERYTLIFLCIFGTLLGCTDESNNQPPTVVITGAPGEIFVVGEVMNIQVDAQDPEGGALDFSFDWKPKEIPSTLGDRAELLTFESSALFKWDPLASDATSGEPVQIVFVVKDEAGQVTEKTVTTKIVPGNGQPVFQSNVSEIYDPRTGRPLIFTVKVADQDSGDVDLKMDEATAPPRSMFAKTGPYEGQFTWMPSADQLEQRIRTVRFVADDSDNPEVTFDVTIVVRSKGEIKLDKDQTEEMCPGEAVITHTPLGPQRGLVEPYVVTANIAGADRFDKVVTFWTFADAYNADFDPQDETKQLNAIEMENDGSGMLRAEIPNQAEIITSDALTISYQICAFDNDAAGDGAIVCAPSSGELELFYTFTALLPDADDCVEDGVDRVSGNDEESTASGAGDTWSYFRACEGNPDFHSVSARAGDSGFIGITYNKGSDIRFNVSTDQGGAVEFEQSTCTGLITFDTSVADGDTDTRYYIEVLGDNIEYQVRYFPISGGPNGCVDEAMEPNETAFDAHEVMSGQAFDAEICDQNDLDLYKIELNPGDEITVDHMFVNQDGNLDMTLFAPSQADDISQSGNGVAFTFSFEDNMETLTHTAQESGTYYLLVFNNNETANDYNISFTVQAAPPCPDTDQFSSGAGNHSQDDAAVISTNDSVELGLQVCPGKDEWLQRTEFNGALVLGELSVTGGDGTIDDVTWVVRNLAGDVVETATVLNGNLDLDFNPPNSGQFFYHISTTTRVEYDLLLVK